MSNLQTHLSPRDLALVIGVSESSLKRWVDLGKLEAVRTVGGHRRIALHEAIRFIREESHRIVRPDLLGVPDLTAAPVEAVAKGDGESLLLRALESGRGDEARGIIVAQYLSSRSVAAVCDGPITHAMHRIGELWRHSDEGIAIEHRATTICVEALHQIRMLLEPPPRGSAVAVGGGLAGDPYMLPTLMAATCFREAGVEDVNLGADTPADSILGAARRHSARFVWVSIATNRDLAPLRADLERLAAGVSAMGASLLLGGRGVYELQSPVLPSTHMVHSMAELSSFARGARRDVAGSAQA